MILLLGVLFVAWYLVLLGPFAQKRVAAGPAAEAPTGAGVAGAPAEGERKLPSLRDVEDLLSRAREMLSTEERADTRASGDPFEWPAEALAAGGEETEPAPEPAAEPRPELSFKLSGILWDEVRPLAVINGWVVGKGSVIGEGIRVVEITPESVTVQYRYRGEENRLVLSLEQGERE
jgi:hypothetical protein